jgi:putative NADH-flavin reductase
MQGTDAVICVLGLSLAASRKPTVLYSEGTRHVMEAMTALGLRRLVVVTGIGAGDSKGHGGFVYDRIFQPLLLGEAYKDKTRQEELVRASNLDWVIVRPGALNDGPARGSWQEFTGGEYTAGSISRADVAAFLLRQLSDDTYLRRPVVIAY